MAARQIPFYVGCYQTLAEYLCLVDAHPYLVDAHSYVSEIAAPSFDLMDAWCRDNVSETFFRVANLYLFRHTTDAALFKLRWG